MAGRNFRSYNSINDYYRLTHNSIFGGRSEPNHSKQWEELTEEYTFTRTVGIISPKLLRLLTAYAENDLKSIAIEWKATDEQKELLNQAGLDSVRRRWDKTNRIDADRLVELYNRGIKEYVEEHKRLG